MPKKILFSCEEALRLIRGNPENSITFLLFNILNISGIAVIFIFILNINYLLDLSTTSMRSNALLMSLIPLIGGSHWLRLILMFLLAIFIMISVYVHKLYLTRFMKYYHREIELIKRLNFNWQAIKGPFLMIAFSVNGLALIIVRGLLGFGYGFISQLIVQRYLRISLLHFQNFDSALIIFLLTVTLFIILTTIYILLLFDIKGKLF